MKAITLYEPAATAIAWGLKGIESRTHDRFRSLLDEDCIAIHAGKKFDEDLAREMRRCLKEHKLLTDADVDDLFRQARANLGKVVCTVNVMAAVKLHAEDEREVLCRCAGMFGLEFDTDSVEEMKPPVPAKGGRGIWNWNRPEGPPITGPSSDLASRAGRAMGAQIEKWDAELIRGGNTVELTAGGRTAVLGKGRVDAMAKKGSGSEKAAPDDDKPAAWRRDLDRVNDRLRVLAGSILSHAENVQAEGEYTDTLEAAAKAVESARKSLDGARTILRAASNVIAEGGVTGEQTELTGNGE